VNYWKVTLAGAGARLESVAHPNWVWDSTSLPSASRIPSTY